MIVPLCRQKFWSSITRLATAAVNNGNADNGGTAQIHKLISMNAEIITRLAKIEVNSLLAAKNVLTLDDVALLTGLSKSRLYKLTCSRQIPHYKPNGKNIYFDRVEIEAWMKQNRVNTIMEAEQQAAAYIITKGGR